MITEYGFFSENKKNQHMKKFKEVEPSNDLEGDAENVSTDLGS
jgi:hypothetical protein